jgi:hypothetical protein
MSAILSFANIIQAVLAARDSICLAIQNLLALYKIIGMQDVETRIKAVLWSTRATVEVTINMRGTL